MLVRHDRFLRLSYKLVGSQVVSVSPHVCWPPLLLCLSVLPCLLDPCLGPYTSWSPPDSPCQLGPSAPSVCWYSTAPSVCQSPLPPVSVSPPCVCQSPLPPVSVSHPCPLCVSVPPAPLIPSPPRTCWSPPCHSLPLDLTTFPLAQGSTGTHPSIPDPWYRIQSAFCQTNSHHIAFPLLL